MKIAVVGLMRHPIAEPFAGGMESHTWWLAKKLIERGHDVNLFASGDSDRTLGLSACTESSLKTHPQAQTLAGEQACNMSAYASAIKQICHGQFDIVHNNALHPLLLLSAADLPVPMLMTLHAPVYPELAAAIQYAAARNASGNLAVAAVSGSLAAQWEPLIKAEIIYNGIDVDSWTFESEPMPNLAMWYGRFVPEKGPHLAIQAALKAGYSIQVAGPIGNKAYFEEKVLPLIDQKQVSYLGHLLHSEVKQALKRASVFVNAPMWEEPYGIVYAEALASGTPVATFNRGAAGEILDDRCGVVVKERTVEALARGVIQAAKLSRYDCRERAESFCHVDSMVDGYERLYRKLIARQRQNERLARQEAIAMNVALASMKSPLNEIEVAS
ncbi:MAG: glycosyltransferase family 4 protein [Phormidesmis priestleyi]|uniref:Glycosyltransferase family 4 protein n=1 Tax=Phormidesmis priestleyi TaxID=268141 RepID=A0A2W4WNG0_9CYAN|nr:MAG: glycosyltransferase family 4 protein [Phormidesmis priestleyi]